MLLIIDNYDSFTWNLRQYFGQLAEDVFVVRNDEITLEQIDELNPSHIVISPGPGTPDNAGISLPAIKHFCGKIPILGVCLGHQAIAQVFSANIVKAHKPMHGKQSLITHRKNGLFSNIKQSFMVTRYHSLVIDDTTLHKDFIVDAWIEADNETPREIMAIRHKNMPLWGIQFHPESILTEFGHQLLANFLQSNLQIEGRSL